MSRFTRVVVALAFASLSLASTAWAQQSQLDELEAQLAALKAEIAKLTAGTPAGSSDLAQRVQQLEGEVEQLRSGGGGGAAAELKGRMGFAPAASKVYGAKHGLVIGGYSELLFERYADERQDGAASGRFDQLDMLRQVVYVGYKFDDRVLFNSELEFEHGSTGKGGEVSVEMAYVDYRPRKGLGVRAGLVLVPMGWTNEQHEPPIFRGAKRPEVESAIIPSTWREPGIGLFGEAGPLNWRAYLITGLSSTGLNASGIRGARQSGARARAEDMGVVGRLELSTAAGFTVGASGYTGESGQGAQVGGRTLEARVSIGEAHAQFERSRWQIRGLAALSRVSDAALVNAQNNLSGSSSVGSGQYGWYLQATYAVSSFDKLGTWTLHPFVRYERLDTQDGVPAGFSESGATDRSVLVAGLDVKPRFNLALKLEFQRHRNQARSAANQVNVGLGVMF